MNLFFTLGIIIVSATILGYIAKMLRQPLIPAYILAGVILGPIGLGVVDKPEEIKILSEIGIAFLLFIVGLELEFSRLKDIGLIASLGGVIQILVLSFIGLIVAIILPMFGFIEGIYLGLVVAFSSTMVVIKILSDKKELETLHGRIVIGILLMQDLIAIFALSILGGVHAFSSLFFLMAILKACIIIWATIISSRFVFPPLFSFAAKSQELLFLLAVTVCFIFAFLADKIGVIVSWFIQLFPIKLTSDIAYMIEPGFSIAIGAFFAGVALANLPYNFEIVAKVKPLRDFFSTLFFASIGMELVFLGIGSMIIPIILFVVLIIVIKPFIIMVLCNSFGYARRTSFLSAIALSQASEFSLIIVSQGFALGHIGAPFFSMTILITVTTIIISSYFIKFDKEIFMKTSGFLKPIELIGARNDDLEYHHEENRYNILLVGYDRIGYSVIKTARKIRKSILVIDYNPDTIRKLIKEKISCMYGDIGDIELMERINLKDTEIVISTVPDIRDNAFLIKQVKDVNSKISVIVTANSIEEALALYEVGADYVILPHFLGGDHLSLMLEDMHQDIKKIINAKIRHISELHHRKSLGHQHPSRSRLKEDH